MRTKTNTHTNTHTTHAHMQVSEGVEELVFANRGELFKLLLVLLLELLLLELDGLLLELDGLLLELPVA